ncbi:hypothetical protein PRIPAC_70227, partial [Pristionchus pacificus]|uniref:Hedgehog receptor n=1 Tax=Pristionchus pacificus TaxID=54126 RepID=A0A2A6C8G8_PRIPA
MAPPNATNGSGNNGTTHGTNRFPVPSETEKMLLPENNNEVYVIGTGAAPKKKTFWHYLSLRGLFGILGKQVGTSPFRFIIIAFLISLSSIGMYKIVLKDRITDGYTPINAPSRYETDVLREFWNSSGDPMQTMLILTAKDEGSMHRKAYLDEATNVINFFNSKFSGSRAKGLVFFPCHSRNGWRKSPAPLVPDRIVDGVARRLSPTVGRKRSLACAGVFCVLEFNKMCEPYCGMTTAFDMFKTEFDNVYSAAVKGDNVTVMALLHHPVANLNGFEVHLERYMFGVKTREAGASLPPADAIERRITNMDYVQVIMMIFRGDKGTDRLNKMMETWELAAYDETLQFNNSLLDVMLFGTDILDREMIRDGERLKPFFSTGFLIMISFVMICVLFTAVFLDEMDRGKVLISCVATTGPTLAITASYGIVSLLGLRVNSFMLVMPFLIMGIGVDDAFLMTHAWHRLSRQGYSVPERLSMVYEEVGPSITITSLTNVLSFGIGAFTPTPEVRLFCIGAAIAMAIAFVMQLILFGPILAIACRWETKGEKDAPSGWRKTLHDAFNDAVKAYCRLLGNKIFTVAVGLGMIVYWTFGIMGLLNIKTILDPGKILPPNSPIQVSNAILRNIVWAEYHPVTILVNTPFNVSDPQQIGRFFEMVDDFERLPKCKGAESSLIWLRDYADYTTRGEPEVDMFAMMMGEVKMSNTEHVDPLKTNMTLKKLDAFLASPFYKHWSSFLKQGVDKSGERIITQFRVDVAYQNTTTWEIRIDLMVEFRDLVARYKDLNASVWEHNGFFVDQMLSLKGVAIETGLLTLLCMAVVCAAFIPNPVSLISAIIAIASISMGVMGYLSWWGFDLDPVVMAAVIMSIGMSVDFTAHVSYHYQLTSKKVMVNGKVKKETLNGKQDKLEHTLESVGLPMLQAGASTIFCILPLLFIQSYNTSVFVCAIVLVVGWGLLHGLIVLPAFLACLPSSVTDINLYSTYLSTSSEKSCRYRAFEMLNKLNVLVSVLIVWRREEGNRLEGGAQVDQSPPLGLFVPPPSTQFVKDQLRVEWEIISR